MCANQAGGGSLARRAAPPGPLAQLADVAEAARDYAGQAKAPNTLRAYRSDWQHFAAWCETHGLTALPASAETVAFYLTSLAGGRKTSTLQRRLSAISQAHKTAGHDAPTSSAAVRLVWQGIRRAHGTAQEGKAPATVDALRRMVATLPTGPIGVRDRALLLLGFAGAFRRSELVALDIGDVQETTDGLIVTLRRSKTDQEGAGRLVGVPYGSNPDTCPVRALRSWLELRSSYPYTLRNGPLFVGVDRHGRVLPGRLSDRAVALIVKRCAERAGLDAAKYAGHSLRAGLATSAAAADVPERVIAQQTGHRSMAVLRRYIREGSLFRENAAARVGL